MGWGNERPMADRKRDHLARQRLEREVAELTAENERLGNDLAVEHAKMARLDAILPRVITERDKALAEWDVERARREAAEALCEMEENRAAALGRDITDEGYEAWVRAEDIRAALAAAAVPLEAPKERRCPECAHVLAGGEHADWCMTARNPDALRDLRLAPSGPQEGDKG